MGISVVIVAATATKLKERPPRGPVLDSISGAVCREAGVVGHMWPVASRVSYVRLKSNNEHRIRGRVWERYTPCSRGAHGDGPTDCQTLLDSSCYEGASVRQCCLPQIAQGPCTERDLVVHRCLRRWAKGTCFLPPWFPTGESKL